MQTASKRSGRASLLRKLKELDAFIGGTPLKRLDNPIGSLYAKLEYNNFSGSVKDRAAFSMIYHAIKDGKIDDRTTIVASSSGNLAIAAALICKFIGLRFIPVIDPNINDDYEALLSLVCFRVEKVDQRDQTGGFLLTRLAKVSAICTGLPNSFVLDQYGDPNNYRGYYKLGIEVLSSLNPEYVFVAISSGGVVTGLSKSLKSKRPNIKVIGVDVEGSVIFGQTPQKRYISGIGSSLVPSILKDALIDEVIHISQIDIATGCRQLLTEQLIFAGASSGAVYLAATRYMDKNTFSGKPTALLLFADKGYPYLDTIYNEGWVKKLACLSDCQEK